MSSASSPTDSSPPTPGVLSVIGNVLGRSLFPFVSLAIILGTIVWGPWVTLVLALVWWNIVTRIG